MLPARVIHADWSANARKRWMAEAVLGDDGRYTAHAPRFVRDPGLFMLMLLNAAAGCALVGFDFPIGLPVQYAKKAKIKDFLSALPQFGEENSGWADFYTVAARADEINLRRPFYPASAGGKTRADLTKALGVSELRRQCDRKTAERKAAAELFWTMGAQQVGKAAISGWKEILGPALRIPDMVHLAIWPFSGTFEALIQPGWIVACEAYPAEYYAPLGVKFPRKKGGKSGKRVREDRTANAPALIAFAENAGIRLDGELFEALDDGFGSDAYGEDRFDALVGLLGMLSVALGYRAPGEPQTAEVAEIEGWILGMANE